MVDGLIKNGESPPNQFDESNDENAEQNRAFLSALPIVRKIANRRAHSALGGEKSDLLQAVALRLWRWRTKHREKSDPMREKDWQAFAARTSFNEIKRHFSERTVHEPLGTAAEIVSDEQIVGNAQSELESLARFAWQEICRLTVRQRRALLLQNQDLIVKLSYGGVSNTDFARALELQILDWLKLKDELPLTDIRIAEMQSGSSDKLALQAAAKSIKKARHEARAKLGGVLK